MTQVERLAAVSGTIDPSALGAHLGPADLSSVLGQVQRAFTVVREPGGVRWTLSPNRRHDVLRELIATGQLSAQLQAPLVATDPFGEMLRRLLREGAALDTSTMERADLLALARALEVTEGLDMARPDPNEVSHRLDALDREQNVLLEQGLIGRDQELRRLLAFVTEPRPSSGPQFGGLLISGLGGSGKSTLLAAFQNRVAAEDSATVVLLDFDRAGVDPGDSYWLELEMSRQVGHQHLAARDRLARVRAATREEQAHEQAASDGYRGESDLHKRRQIIESIRDAVHTTGRPLVLLLDTFEEVTQVGVEGQVFEWLSSVGERLHPVPLKVIVSGRLMSPDSASRALGGAADTVELGELDPEAAEELLRLRGVSQAAAHRLANSDVLPRRPLELKLLARLMATRPASEVEAVENELRASGAAAAELFAGIVYRRVLLRIQRRSTRDLAYPGLVLRYVTADLIGEVLVPALGLALIETPEDAFYDLVRYEWLVTHDAASHRVWHRRDLRRSMLKAMVGQERELAARVHAKAAAYFRARLDPDDQLEALYHEAMVMCDPETAERYSAEQMASLAAHLGGDVDDLPPYAAAFVRFAVGSPLAVHEVALLPSRYRDQAYGRVGEAAVRDGEWGKALRLHESGLRNPKAFWHAWEVEALFATARWERIAPDREGDTTLLRLASFNEIVFFSAFIRGDSVNDPADTGRAVTMLRPADGANASEVDWSRFVTALTLVDAGGRLPEDARRHVEVLRSRGRQSPARWLARRVARQSPQTCTRLELWTPLLPIDEQSLEQWVTTLTPVLDASAEQALCARIDQFRAVREQHGTRLRALLAELSRHEVIEAELKHGLTLADLSAPTCRLVFGGNDADLRAPARFALLDAFQTADPRTLGQLLGDLIPLDLPDLAPSRFAEMLARQPEHGLEPLVEIADRCGVLRTILLGAVGVASDATRLQFVLDAQERLRRAVDACAGALQTTPSR